MKQSASRQSIRYITVLRAVSCIAVVLLHTCLAAGSTFEMPLRQRTVTMVIRNLTLWAVPCFIMVTGALLLDPERPLPYSKLFKKYVVRIFLAIAVFTALFLITDMVLNGEPKGMEAAAAFLYKVWAGKSWSHMWYLYMLLGLYFLMPFYRMIAAYSKKRDYIYLLSVYFLFLSVLPMLRSITDDDIAFFICVSAVYPLYLFAGHILHQGIFHVRAMPALAVFVLCSCTLSGLTVYAYQTDHALLKDLLGAYSFPVTLLQSLSLFSLFCSAHPEEESIFCRIWRRIDRNSFGIYLIHMLFLKLLYVAAGFDPYQAGGVFMLFPVAIGVFCLSYASVEILRRIPLFRRFL